MSQNTHSFMGTTPIKPLLLSMSAPVMLSMLISAIYNLVDSIYVAQVSDLDFLALSYAYPIQLLMIAFCTGTGIGFSAIFSKKLGEGDKKTAKNPELWGRLLDLLDKHEVRFHWVKGHADNPYNNRCDELAVGEYQKYK